MNSSSKRVLLISPCLLVLSAIVIFLLHNEGAFQFVDFRVYDQFVRWRAPSNQPDPYVTIVGITEADVRDGWPISDRALAIVLEKLTAMDAAAVAVDLYRDIPVPASGLENDALRGVVRGNSNIVMVGKMGSGGRFDVPPPGFLSDLPDQVGFNDLLIDGDIDNAIRRAILFMDDGERHFFSLAFQLASRYLAERGIYPEFDTDAPQTLRYGAAEIFPVQPDTGAYARADDGGYQVVMDFRGPATYPVVSFSNLVEGRVPIEAIENRIVIIGTVAESLKDHNMTPLKYRHWGVELHAAVTNQIIRFALGEDVPIRVWASSTELLWIAFWTVIGGICGFVVRRPLGFVLTILGGIGMLAGLTGMAFSMNLWIPITAPIVALIAASVPVHLLYSYEQLKGMFRQLRFANKALADANKNLEMKVQDRTRELHEKNELLVDLNREKNEFLGMAAHDLRSPLSAIQGFADTIVEDFNDYDSDQILKFAGIISRSTHRMFAMINNLLDVNAIETGKMNLSIAKIDFRTTVSEVVDHHKSRATEKKIDLNFSMPSDKISIMADHEALQQVLDNLVSNAIKFSPSGTVITVTLRDGRDFACCDVSDQGPGLHAEDQGKLFEKFARLSPRPTGGEQSTGLGLFIVRKLVESMSGKVSYDSLVGSGTTFTVELPRATAPACDPSG